MPDIILDKSYLNGVSRGHLAREMAARRVIITTELLYEIVTCSAKQPHCYYLDKLRDLDNIALAFPVADLVNEECRLGRRASTIVDDKRTGDLKDCIREGQIHNRLLCIA